MTYSPEIPCIYDEASPTEDIGRGAHYSVLRVPLQSTGPSGRQATAKIRDIAVIWDEDHDLRIITAIERLHSQSLLTHALFIGERKGTFTLLIDGSYYGRITDYRKDLLRRQVARQVASIGGDHWQVAIGSFSPVGINDETIMESIIDADDSKIEAYLRRIGVKWCLGTKLAHDLAYMDEAWSESERSPRLDPSKDSVPNWMTLEHD